MAARITLAFCAFMVPILGFADSRDKECQEWTRQAVENPAVGCEAACPQAKRFDRYSYHAGLVAAQKDLAGLGRFVRYTARSTIIGAGSDEQACHLYSLLLQWGDSPFAKVVSDAGSKAKERVVGLLDYAAVTDFNTRFPKTFGLVAKHE
jgi:hypothetical protein